jgi:hypothetical protein
VDDDVLVDVLDARHRLMACRCRVGEQATGDSSRGQACGAECCRGRHRICDPCSAIQGDTFLSWICNDTSYDRVRFRVRANWVRRKVWPGQSP